MASVGKRWLIGCGLGCLALVVVAIALVGGFTLWLRGSGELLEPRKLLGSDTAGHVEWTLRMEDPATEGFVRSLIDAIQTLPPDASSELPPWLMNWLVQRQHSEAERGILEMFPMAVAWTVRPGETPADDLHLFSVSIERLGHRIIFGDWILGWILPRNARVEIDRYRDEKIYRLPLNHDRFLTAFVREGNVFFTSDLDTARIAVDRLIASSASSREPSEVDRLFAGIEGDGPMRGAISNRRGEFLRMWQWLSSRSDLPADRDLWDGVRSVSVAGGLRDDGSLAVTLQFLCPDETWAEARTGDLVMGLHDGLAWTGLTLDLQARPVEDRVVVELRAIDLVDSIGHWFQHAREIETDRGTVRIDF